MKAARFHSKFIPYSGGVQQRHAFATVGLAPTGGALRAYDKNRLHPIPASFAVGQYCAVNLAGGRRCTQIVKSLRTHVML
jgi:hypothetical protein